MACTNCFDNCPGTPVSDKCVKYTGDAIPLLGITTGDTLFSVEGAIITKLLDVLDGVEIDLSSTTIDCDFLISILAAKDKTLANLIQMLVTASCTLRDLITEIDDQINANYSFNTSCLTLGTSPSRDDILQATITKLCSLNTEVGTIKGDYVKTSQLCTLVKACIAESNTSTGAVQENSKMSKYIAYPYHGPLSVFDSNGTGLSSSGYEKVYLCIGQTINGFTLPDYRGRSPMGANSGVPTTNIDNTVNPALLPNASYGLTNKQKKGTYIDTLTSNQMPSHSHTVTDPGHDHSMGAFFSQVGDDNNNTLLRQGGSQKTLKSTTGITIASTGGNQAHNSLHPVVGSYFIMYVPS